jgi:ethanolamine utilization protein EutQ (cupin superfamily)
MSVRKTRWSKVYESSEEELVAFLAARNAIATRWTAGEFEQVVERTLAADTDIYLAEGSAKFNASGQNFSMQPGDTIYLPAATILSVIAGMSGCVCYETSPEKN